MLFLALLLQAAVSPTSACSGGSCEAAAERRQQADQLADAEDASMLQLRGHVKFGPLPPPPINGGCDDFKDCCVKCETCDFAVALFFSDGICAPPISHAYSRCPDGDPCLGRDEDWTPQNKLSTFDYMQTAQFVICDDCIVRDIFIDDQRDTSQGATAANCMAVYHKDSFFAGFSLGVGNFDLQANSLSPTKNDPLQMTFMPFVRADGNCDQGVDPSQGGYDPQRALGVFLSLNQWTKPAGTNIPTGLPDDTTTCHLKANDKLGSDCGVTYPYWKFDSSMNSVLFQGSLVDLLANGSPSPLFIELDDSLYLEEFPLNSLYVNFPIVQDGGCQSAVDDYLNNDRAPPGGLCVVGPPSTPTVDTGRRIVITGFGVVSGRQVIKDYKENYNKNYENYPEPACGTDTSPTCDISDNFRLWAEWQVRASLMTLSSSFSDNEHPAIDVSGVSVAYSPKLNQGAVQLNSAFRPSSGGLDHNNFPCKVFDFKMPSNWVDGSDGPEVMGYNFDPSGGLDAQRTYMAYLYLLINDDAVKVATPFMLVQDITALQGNVGGVINYGAYGKNRGLEGSSVSGVYVHRITQNNHNGLASFDNYGGLIVTRTCPVKKLLENPDDWNKLEGSVDRLFVAGMGFTESDGTGQGPNSVTRPFSIGLQNWEFCGPKNKVTNLESADPADLVSTYYIGEMVFTNFAIDTDPVAASLLYDCRDFECQAGVGVVTQEWGELNFGSASDLDAAPTICKFGADKDAAGNPLNCYYVCSSAVDPSTCWNSFGQGGAQGAETAPNLDFSPSWSFSDDQIVFPS